MNPFFNAFNSRLGIIAVLAAMAMAGCGGGLDPILGTPSAGMAPTVIATTPVATTPAVTGVATNSRVTATFSKPMAAASLTSTSFTVACPSGTAVAGGVAYDAVTRVATFTPTATLAPNTTCVATVTTAATDTAGFTLAANFVWSFATAALADNTRPTVVFTVPSASATGVATNTRITATFSEAMMASTISGTSFTVTNNTLSTPVAGSVVYAAATRTATFTPTAGTLAINTAFTATVTTAATDLTGNALSGNTAVIPNAGNHVWTFTTAALTDTTPPTVLIVSPVAGGVGICLTKVASASFSEPMDAATINATSFTVTDGGVAVPGSVSYDAALQLASFTPTSAAGFAPSRTFTATVLGGAAGVKDLAGNPLAANRVWTFTTGTTPCTTGVNLGTAAAFSSFGGNAGITNQGINTVVGGNIGTTAACTLITGFHDAVNVYTQTPLNIGGVNGSINCAPPAPGTASSMAIATQALADAQTAYNALAALPPGSDPGAGQLGGLVLAPGVYTAAGGSFAVTTGNLTLDAQGDANAVWVFQMATSLTVGLPATPRSVTVINGGQARNVYWKVGSAGRIEDRSTMVGTIIAPAGVTISTAGQTGQTTLTGRAIGLVASVTMVNTTVVAP